MPGPRVEVDIVTEPNRMRELGMGGAFVMGLALGELAECELAVCANGNELTFPARVIMVTAQGCAIEILGFGPAIRERLKELAELPPKELAHEQAIEAEIEAEISGDLDLDGDGALETHDLDPATTRVPRLEAIEELELLDLAPAVPLGDPVDEQSDAPTEEADDDVKDEKGRKISRNVHERLRGLNLAQQVKMAQTGESHERIVLERMYGKTVWEALLRNPRITGPEVARIARMGALPRPMIEIIVGNGGWLQIPEVRRALLTNPRLGTDQIIKVLRMLPKHELKYACVQTSYPSPVRDQARRLQKENDK